MRPGRRIGDRPRVDPGEPVLQQTVSLLLDAALALSAEEKMSVEDPLEMEKLADALPLERAASRWIVSNDPDEHVRAIAAKWLGFIGDPRAIPALIKGYLRLGGFVGDGAFIDHPFNTTDVCLVLDTSRIDEKRRAIYAGGAG